MESNSNTDVNQVDLGAVKVDFDVELILGIHALGGKGSRSRMSVPVGRVAVLSHDEEAFDYDGLPEIYLAGETTTRSSFRKDAQCVVAEMAEYPGTVTVSVTQQLAGISLTDRDVASAKFLYHLRLENPIKLLSREPKWMTREGPGRLRTRIENLIGDDLRSTLNSNIHLWSHPDIREVSGDIFSRLDRKLKAWGLRLDSEVPAYRVYPPLLYEVALQFKASERDLLEAGAAEERPILERLGLRSADLLEIRNISAQMGAGAGLFVVAKDKKERIDPFVEWLASEEQMALAAANFLREICSSSYTAQEVELTQQVLLSAFRNPVLGLGERGDTEHGIVDTSQFGQLEAHFKAVFGATD